MKRKHRNPIIAACVSLVVLATFVGTLLACARRFNKDSIARRAREAQQTAAEAVTRAERHRRRALDLPEAEAAPVNGKYKGPALGNVVIKDVAAFRQMKDELIEVDVPEVRGGGAAPKTKAVASPGVSEDRGDTFAMTDINEPLSTSLHGMHLAHFPSEDRNEGDLNDNDGEEAPAGISLEDGGFVIVVCGSSTGTSAQRMQGNGHNENAGTEVASDAEAAVDPRSNPATPSTNAPTIHFYRHQPSRSIYGESRYTNEVDTQALC